VIVELQKRSSSAVLTPIVTKNIPRRTLDDIYKIQMLLVSRDLHLKRSIEEHSNKMPNVLNFALRPKPTRTTLFGLKKTDSRCRGGQNRHSASKSHTERPGGPERAPPAQRVRASNGPPRAIATLMVRCRGSCVTIVPHVWFLITKIYHMRTRSSVATE
jgi:hypothetical protein